MTYAQDTISENNQFVNKFELASDYTDDGDFHRAIAIYSGLLEEQPNSYNLNFKILDDDKDSGITPLVKELIGVIPKKYSNNEIDNMYKKHLDEKYL
jgi:hypothetical protein